MLAQQELLNQLIDFVKDYPVVAIAIGAVIIYHDKILNFFGYYRNATK